ncbi:zinc finger and BTB domain-containing protein 14-like [Macrosteles quadrilineatus]|uniref:zinc finger and BTB domain-containing protein 14-like n=1 Tax=Macrosteles quadrilineatus TaxID=74068 RepID=UPI0023E30BEB|nr:zinc finger and BTB domain-containing protein 14-like [Macrosteles quadrilineatus]XP_054283967.1 zinc finger and BTB domain-containing protein 14-like [Macrosteles quadrilineatus]
MMDVHKCGDCQEEFNSYETFLIHKLLIEQYKLTLESSLRIPSLRLPKFIKINQVPKPSVAIKETPAKTSFSTDKENGQSEMCKKPKTFDAPELLNVMDAACDPIIEIIVDATNSGDDAANETVNDDAATNVVRDDVVNNDVVSDDIAVNNDVVSGDIPVQDGIVGDDIVNSDIVSDDILHNNDDASDDSNSVGSQPESLRIDEGVVKEMSPVDTNSEFENDNTKEFYCKECKRYYKNRVILRVHEETVHSTSRPHVCQWCRLGFKTKGSLVRHCRTHTGERPFSCGQCLKAFLDSGSLARHVHRVHRKRPFKQPSDVKVVIARLEVETEKTKTQETLGS